MLKGQLFFPTGKSIWLFSVSGLYGSFFQADGSEVQNVGLGLGCGSNCYLGQM